MNRCFAAIGLAAASFAPLAAQARTWIVDQTNGPGTDFLDLPSAVAVAADGDTIRIRAGSYTNISTGNVGRAR